MLTEQKPYFCHDYEVPGPDLETTKKFFRSTVDLFLNNESYTKSVWNGVSGYTQSLDFDMNNQKFKIVSSEGRVGLDSNNYYDELAIEMFKDGRVCDYAILKTYYKDNQKANVISTEIGYRKEVVNGENKKNINENEKMLRIFQLIQKINPVTP